MYLIYGKKQCPYCDQAKALLNMKGMPFEYVDIGESEHNMESLKAMMRACDQPMPRTVPQIFVITTNPRGEVYTHIGGFKELQESFKK